MNTKQVDGSRFENVGDSNKDSESNSDKCCNAEDDDLDQVGNVETKSIKIKEMKII